MVSVKAMYLRCLARNRVNASSLVELTGLCVIQLGANLPAWSELRVHQVHVLQLGQRESMLDLLLILLSQYRVAYFAAKVHRLQPMDRCLQFT